MARERRRLLGLGIAFEAGLGAVGCLLGWLVGLQPWNAIHCNAQAIGLGLAACIPMLLGFLACLYWPWEPIASTRKISEDLIVPLFRPCTVTDLLIISLAAGLGEEILFRGLIQDYFGLYLENWAAVLLASVIFGLVHPITPVYVVLAGLMGVYLGWIFLASENLVTVIVAHGVYDFVALVYLTRTPAQSDSPTVSVNGKSG